MLVSAQKVRKLAEKLAEECRLDTEDSYLDADMVFVCTMARLPGLPQKVCNSTQIY